MNYPETYHIEKLVEIYAECRGIGTSRVASLIWNDGKFFSRVRAGGNFTVKSYHRGLRWFADNWPPQTPWPEGVPRPEPTQREVA
ncbi:MAG: hypothetical protein GDA50_05025 [Alphaproteobacteria bacterium GM202ARS2]|nr:hypothetical protein [Alphaproteobacteria bacterium GM202ARS2]